MPLLLKKLSQKSKRISKGTSKALLKSSQRSNIFRLGKKSDDQQPEVQQQKEQEQEIQPQLTWTTSCDSEESSPVLSPSNSSVGSSSSENESFQNHHSGEVERLTAEITALETSKEAAKMEKEASEQVMLQQENEIIKMDSEITSLRNALTEFAKLNKESSSSKNKNVVSRTILPEEIFGNEYQRKYEAAQTIIYHQEIEIVTKAEEISFLQSTLQAQEDKHETQVKLLLNKLLEREDEIEKLKEKVQVTSELVSQTASMLLNKKSFW